MNYEVRYVAWKSEKAFIEATHADDERFCALWDRNVRKFQTYCPGENEAEAAAVFFGNEIATGSKLVITDDVWFSYMRRPDGSVLMDIHVLGQRPEEFDTFGHKCFYGHRPADIFDLYNQSA